MYKILLNSAYGKFAQNDEDFKEYRVINFKDYTRELIFEDPERPWLLEFEYGNGYGIIARDQDKSEVKLYNVATAASITGAARSILMRAIHANRDRILYCDTDSIFTIGQACGIVINSTVLGAWKREYEDRSITEAHIGGKKCYALFDTSNEGVKHAMKGGRSSPHVIKAIVDGMPYLHQNDAPVYNRDGTVKMFVQRSISATVPSTYRKWDNIDAKYYAR
jgi:DNA polymerase elongation subunit (family B)